MTLQFDFSTAKAAQQFVTESCGRVLSYGCVHSQAKGSMVVAYTLPSDDGSALVALADSIRYGLPCPPSLKVR